MNAARRSDTDSTGIAIIGAGPYGLSLAAHLKARRLDFRIFGDPMAMWRSRMPKGMRLKSEGFASSLYDPGGILTLARYCADNDLPYADVGLPVPLETFTQYGLEFQRRFVPDVENRTVSDLRSNADGFKLTFEDGGVLSARRVVVAVGIGHFAWLPPMLEGVPPALVTHSSDHHGLEKFADRDVAVIGAGASAVDIAALLQQAGARPTLVARTDQLRFQDPPPPRGQSRPLAARLRWPISGIGNGWKSYLCAELPLVFRAMPEPFRLTVVRTHLGPAPCWFTRDEINGRVALRLGRSVDQIQADQDRLRLSLSGPDGAEELLVDHLIAATGYRADLRRVPFLSPELRGAIAKTAETPILSSRFESSVAGLFFVGALSANTFGPLTRFAFGAGFAAERVTERLARAH
ncbi:NAD(P)-binding domain-containing protein [Bradyrhizobium sp.]|uniref:NAD(P)-binding domain-containing protein n=1 Tax=Bradyrhizobium sp. TaxID=376 RepID=UPI001D355D4F|nr:NAD(P)-binding domain-containing protein [Bradyrhizobium sp.]MBV8698960.1 NAD(P)/FAD-dependent oxidoreductase [Bradyrhizobium sp.]MBV8920746.1 NAD(P)/FAD-dependent oxidoreductase [Bradyrhizobium sp.]MBV9983520.1 NAD(P)/FAD-dependent oxidoreductase [Bradyrhizobium sp.]